MLDYFREKDFIGRQVYIPGDISSAAYFIVAASIIKDSSIVFKRYRSQPYKDWYH